MTDVIRNLPVTEATSWFSQGWFRQTGLTVLFYSMTKVKTLCQVWSFSDTKRPLIFDEALYHVCTKHGPESN